MPPKPQHPRRKERFVAYLSKAERKALKEVQEHYHQPTLASAFRMMIDKARAQMELAPLTEKGE